MKTAPTAPQAAPPPPTPPEADATASHPVRLSRAGRVGRGDETRPVRATGAASRLGSRHGPRGAGAWPKPAASAPNPGSADTVAVELSRQGVNLKLSFPFLTATAGAVFQRADTLWIVFDAKASIDISALDGEATRTIRAAEFTHTPDAAIVRIRLDRPRLSERHDRRIGLDRDDRRRRARSAARARTHPQRGGSQPLDRDHRVRTAAAAAPHRRPGGRRPALRRHRRAADPRLPQSPGLRRIPCAGVGPGRGDRAACGRPRGRAHPGQGGDRPAERPCSVELAAERAARQRLAADDVRFPALGLRPRRDLWRTADESDRRRRRCAGRQEDDAAARSRPLLPRPRHVSGGEGRPRRGLGRPAPGQRGRVRDGAARDRRTDDEPARRRAARPRQSRRRRSARRAAVAGARLCAAGQMGAGARRTSRAWRPRSPRCRSSCSASR